MSPRAKLADVAAAAGVSLSAVSLVLNGKEAGNIAPATRDRILEAAKDLDYRPNSVAQSLRRKRTHVVGLVTDSIASSPFAGRLVAGAMDRATEHGYVLVLVDSQDHREREQNAIDELARRQADGLVYATMGLREIDEAPATRLPLVLANCYVKGGAYQCIIPDEEGAGRSAAQHLIGLGHRDIVMLSGAGETPRGAGNVAGPIRAAGFRASLKEADLPWGPSRVVEVGWQIDNGYAGGMRLLADASGAALPAGQRPTAIWAVTDRVATGVLLAAARLGLDVPGDLSVMGMDDQEELADNVVPKLTTLALPHRAMGELAMDYLLARLARGAGAAGEGAALADPTKLECPLIVRASTAPPAP